MKKIVSAIIMAGCLCASLVAQERKAVIGLTEIKASPSLRHSVDAQAETQLRAAISSAIVNSKRFAVMERSAEELDKIRQENLETNGVINPNSQLDFLFTGEIVEYGARSEKLGGQASAWADLGLDLLSIKADPNRIYTIGLSLKFTDVQSGQIVISETFTKTLKGQQATSNECAQQLASEIITVIADKLYPPTVLAVSSKGAVTIPNSNYEIGTAVEVFSKGEEIFDPYTGQSYGSEEEFVAYIYVYEVSDRIAKAMVDPVGNYKDAVIERGMGCRRRNDMEKAQSQTLTRMKKKASSK